MQDTMAMSKLILVEDDGGLREQLKWALGEHFRIVVADSLDSAQAALEEEGSGAAPIVCLDMGLEGHADRGLEVIDAILASDASAKIIVITANPDAAMAREALRRGAFDYLAKPLDVEALQASLERAERLRQLEGSAEEHAGWSPVASEQILLGESDAMRTLVSSLERLAGTDVGVVFMGESGSGKATCARALHMASRRAVHSFLSVDCSSLPENRLEQDLFGPDGQLESAHQGTLYLAGIDSAGPSLQARLWRFLQDGRVTRPGESRSRVLDVRLVCGTQHPVLAGGDGGLRPDLQHRLCEFEVRVPPLRERGRDALLITEAILERNRSRFGKPRLHLSSRAEKAILAHGWPGNVRELENRLNRACVVCAGQVIEDTHLELDGSGDTTQSYREQRKAFEKNLLVNALRRANGNVSLAARTVGVTRPTFYDMMRKTGIWIRNATKVADSGEAYPDDGMA